MNSEMIREPFIIAVAEKRSQGRVGEPVRDLATEIIRHVPALHAGNPRPAGESAGPRDDVAWLEQPLPSVVPLQKFPEGGAAMAVLRFFFRRQLGKCFLNRGKIKERVVAEAI